MSVRVRTNVGRRWGVVSGVGTGTRGRKSLLACLAAILAAFFAFVSVSHEAGHLDVSSAAAPDAPCATCSAPSDLVGPAVAVERTTPALDVVLLPADDVLVDAAIDFANPSRGPPARGV